MKKRYILGVDFGTLSARALLLDATNGKELADASCAYAHGVMDKSLPCGKRLPPKYALQHPADYVEALQTSVHEVCRKAAIDPCEIAGMGIDFTTCTWLPVDRDFAPLCLQADLADNPHAYVKLWKHHGATDCAEHIDRTATARGEDWFSVYGKKSSSEWALAKTLETLREAPEVFTRTHRFLEAADWLSYLLTGKETHAACFAGLKGFWSSEHGGYPSNDFYKAVDPLLDGIVGTRISPDVHVLPDTAGVLNARGAELTGLAVGTPLALPIPDAHAAIPALNTTREGELLLIIGTSSVHMLNAKSGKPIEGICGYVKDGVIPGLFTYEAGQAGCGDSFDWFVQTCVPASYHAEAQSRGISIHALLRERAMRLTPGESGLLALDWWNGSRSPLKNDRLSGTILGLSLTTAPEDIYRALIEATAYGTRLIIEGYEQNGIDVTSIRAAGGIAQKDPLLMQIYADVTGRTIRVASTTQAGARGSAVYAAVAGGLYPDVQTAAERFALPDQAIYTPNPDHCAVYDRLYAEYRRLHDYFGRGENTVMETLCAISAKARRED